MRNRRILLISFLVIFTHQVRAQKEVTENLDFERIIENLLPSQEYDLDYNDLYDRLFTLYSNPLDLNTLVRADLQALFFLSEEQITGIIDYRLKYGKFISVYELTTIDGFDLETAQRLIPFVVVELNKRASFRRNLERPDNHEVFIRYQTVLEQKKGYTSPDTTSSGKINSRYAGDPNRLYARYLYSKSGEYSFGFTVEKDPGEKLIWDPNTSRYGLDYYSFHAMIENRWIFKKIIIGDFNMDYGQGLVFGSGFRIGKGFEPVTTVRRNNMGLRPYRSVYENKDFSGAAFSTNLKSFEFNGFYSFVRRDAIIREDSYDDRDHFISYIQTVGLHRTASEINAKHQLSDQSIGGNINYKSRNQKLEIGLNGLFTNYNVPLIPNTKKYNQFDFVGVSNHLGGMYFNYHLKNIHAFGEMAISKSSGKAISTGIIASLSSQVQASVHYRNYGKEYHSFYGNAFGENSKIGNEQGIYWGLKILPVPKLIVSFYYDYFMFPWLKYRVNAPSDGHDIMAAATYAYSRKLNFRFQYRQKAKDLNNKIKNEPLVRIETQTTKRVLFDMKYDLDDHFSLKTRLQWSDVDFAGLNSNGFIIAQDLNYKHARYALSARFALFDTDDYDSRQYIYERDLLYVYSIPSFYDKGVRYYLVGKYVVSRSLSFWLKFSQTKYSSRESIGSGLEEINGDTKSNIGFQMRVRI